MEIKKIEFQKQEQAKPNPNESNEQSKAQKSGVENKKKPKKTKKKSKNEAKNNIKESTKKDSIPTEKDYIKQIEKFYKFKVNFKQNINSNNTNNENEYCIVTKEWLKTWKIYVNYKDSKNLIYENLDVNNDIIEAFISTHSQNKPPGNIDQEFTGKTVKEIIDKLGNNIRIVSKDFYQLFPHKIKINAICFKGTAGNFKFLITEEWGSYYVIDYGPNMDGSKPNKALYEVKNKNKEDILNMPLMELRDPNNKDIQLKHSQNNNINNNNNQNQPNQIIVDPIKFKATLKKQEIEGVKDTTMVGIIMPEELKKPIGLNNIGSTCYMNSTIQSFSNVGPLTQYFLKKANKEKFAKEKQQKVDKISPFYADLINQLWDSSNKKNGISPYDFKQKLGEMNPLFAGFKAGDSKDLLNFMIMQMHEELNKAEPQPINNNRIQNIQINQTDEVSMLKLFAEEFTRTTKSKFSDLFYFMTKSTLICGNCHVTTYNFSANFFIIFPLEKVRLFKTLFYGPNVTFVNLYECLTHEKYPVDLNDYYCNYCKVTGKSRQISTFYTMPRYLIIILNRGKGNQFNVNFYIEENIILNNFAEFKNDCYSYNLNSVIVHLGPSGESGHFIAYCVSPIDHKWYLYNDSIVTLCDQKDIGKQINSKGIPYILFYKKCIPGN